MYTQRILEVTSQGAVSPPQEPEKHPPWPLVALDVFLGCRMRNLNSTATFLWHLLPVNELPLFLGHQSLGLGRLLTPDYLIFPIFP